MSEVLIFIALWCGSPINSTNFHVPDVFPRQIQSCREKMMKCVESDQSEKKVWSCAKEARVIGT